MSLAEPALPGDFFETGRPIHSARAPGRLDVMGGIADYAGATVLELPLAQSAWVMVQESDNDLLRVRSNGPAVRDHGYTDLTLPLSALTAGPADAAPVRLRQILQESEVGWAAYLLGPLALLRSEGLLPPLHGLNLCVWSSVPVGAGVSSSAALEVASLSALKSLWTLPLADLQLALLAQQSEHRVAGAPCGLMDQATATVGRANQLLRLRCQPTDTAPAEVLGHAPIPQAATIIGLDSGVAHRVAGTQYGRVRTAAFMGRAIIATQQPALMPGGFLCNVDPAQYETVLESLLPTSLQGDTFLEQYGETGDSATTVDPAVTYAIRACTAHPIYEQRNIDTFLAALQQFEAEGNAAALMTAGEAMYRSHTSYGNRCGLGSPETDLLVSIIRDLGPANGLYGAKITGGGAGGTVAVLGAGDMVMESINQVQERYREQVGHIPALISGSSDGAWYAPVSIKSV